MGLDLVAGGHGLVTCMWSPQSDLDLRGAVPVRDLGTGGAEAPPWSAPSKAPSLTHPWPPSQASRWPPPPPGPTWGEGGDRCQKKGGRRTEADRRFMA